LGGGPLTGALMQGFAVISSDAGHSGPQTPYFGPRDAAEAGWRRLAGDKSLAGLNARYSVDGDQTRLIAGPLASEAAVQALCVELSAVAGQCRVAAPIRAY
jgi:hypothetical protein